MKQTSCGRNIPSCDGLGKEQCVYFDNISVKIICIIHFLMYSENFWKDSLETIELPASWEGRYMTGAEVEEV